MNIFERAESSGTNGIRESRGENVVEAGAVRDEAAGQTDFVRLLRGMNETSDILYAKICGDRRLEALVPIKGARFAHYGFGKNQLDDFILFRDGAISDLERSADPTGGETLKAVKRIELLQPWSNKEYAICVSPAGTDFPHQWLPEHNRVGTVFAVSQRIWLDDEEMTDWTAEPSFRAVRSVRIEQHMLGVHPDAPSEPVAEIDCTHRVDAGGVSVRSAVRWLRPVSIRSGYGMMFPVIGSFAGKLATGFGRTYDAVATDRSKTDMIEDDRCASYAFMARPEETGEAADYVAAMTVSDLETTFRHGLDGRRQSGSVVWLEHRNASIQKLYPQVYDRYTADAGDVYEAAGTYYIGEWTKAARAHSF
ncbi:hypothetical protein [Paenibacillus sp. GYB003]|uniref:hypothetical protein n=1 Tax=Paenibacillus sp. GYB003 TaxID=2994392 RepID=UPI002F962276